MGTILQKSRVMGRLTVFPGVMDSNCTGPIIIGVRNISSEDIIFKAHQSFAQLCITEINLPNLMKCNKILYEQQGKAHNDKGFGSSGNNIEINLIEKDLNFLGTVGFKVKKPLQTLHNTTILDLFADTLEGVNNQKIPLIGERRDHPERKD